MSTPIGPGEDEAFALAIQPDGKIVAAGDSSNGSNLDFALVRYNADGSLDTLFGGGGKVTTAIGTWTDEAYSLVLQKDGKIVVAGKSAKGAKLDFAVARYSADGSLDSNFGSGGKVTTAIGTDSDVALAAAIGADSNLVVAGSSFNGLNFDFALADYKLEAGDMFPPETSITSGPSGTSYGPVTFTFSSSEPGSTFSCRLDTGAWGACTSPKTYTGLAARSHTFEVRATDAAGNTDATAASCTWTVKIDTSLPTTTASNLQTSASSGWHKTAVTVTLTASDTGGSGVNKTYYTIDGTQHTYTSPFAVSAQGSHAVTYWSTDKAGNQENHHTGYVNIDGQLPRATVKALTVRAAKATKGKTLHFKVTISDPVPSCGQASLTVKVTTKRGKVLGKLSKSAEPTNTAFKVAYKIHKRMAKGSYKIVVKATDVAGNVQAKASSAKLRII